MFSSTTFTRKVHAGCCTLLLGAACSISSAQTWGPPVTLDPQEPLEVRTQMAFGEAVSLYGNRALVGAPSTDLYRGAVYVFQKDKSARWALTQKIPAPRTSTAYFGDLIAQDENSALIGERGNQRVFYFERGATGAYQLTLVLRGGPSRQFGNAVALEGCMALVSSAVTSDHTVPRPGLVHMFNRCATGEWVWKASFGAPDAQDGDLFGSSLAMVGSELLVGAPGRNTRTGAAYSFSYRNGAWQPTQKFTQTNGGVGNRFGESVSFRNGMAAIGAPASLREGTNNGEVQIYKRDANRWVPLLTLVEPPGVAYMTWQFGSVVKVTNDRLFVTSHPDFLYRAANTVNIFRRVGDTLQFEKHFNTDQIYGSLGSALDVSQSHLILGEYNRQLPGEFLSVGSGGADIYQMPP